ncbi:MAG: FAD-dependent oxidoreductase [Bacteroidota bacterium]
MIRYELSHWEWESFFKSLDVLVVGSGIVGLSAAIRLKEQQSKLKIMIVDRGPLPIGASTRNAGFACFGSLSELLDDLQHSSREEVLSLVALRFRGLQRLRQRYGDQAIGYKSWGGYELFREQDEDLYHHCRLAMASFNQELSDFIPVEKDWPSTNQDNKVYQVADDKLSQSGLQGIQHLILNRAEGQLHTGKLMQTLLQRAQELGIRCLGGVAIESFLEEENKVHLQTSQGWSLRADKLLIATNGFAQQLLPQLDIKPARNQIMVTEPIEHLPLKGCFHYDKGYVYFRNIGNRILLGGGRNLDQPGEQTTTLGSHQKIRDYLEGLLQTVILPQQKVKIERWWSGIMGVGNTKQPIIKAIGDHTVAAVRLGGMGVAIGTHVGETAADKLLGIKCLEDLY